MQIAHRLEHRYHALEEQEEDSADNEELSRARDRLQFRAQLFHFLGEVEAVFGIWLIPLAVAILVMKGWSTLTSYGASIHSGLVAGDSHGGTCAGIFYHGTSGDDDLCAAASAEVLRFASEFPPSLRDLGSCIREHFSGRNVKPFRGTMVATRWAWDLTLLGPWRVELWERLLCCCASQAGTRLGPSQLPHFSADFFRLTPKAPTRIF
jgi:hypothetical protein